MAVYRKLEEEKTYEHLDIDEQHVIKVGLFLGYF